ncbi:kinase-like protein [Cucurbitaria berberidis CBS 394.84]|uniref:Kinase-like protein n=1 Tax=Cucurbitaria berberidis CBS 394.84 TaxID=1168544 RepID=A0A9P4GKN5_9PLEO|nr:kinase-like protein [Cucurbitaria berberidis CBS 394.84]KAF1846866.1 kinase-like protein [Cucurbitaria berberidis CBS 394.84]
MLPNAASTKTLRAQIQDELARKIQNSDSIADAYIRYQDIRQAWSGHDTIQHALHPVRLSPADIDSIRDRLLEYLSILVYIGADEFLDNCRDYFFDVQGNVLHDDSKLPVKEQQVPPVGSFHLRQRFFSDQFLFKPETLVESSIIKNIDSQRRLPFEFISRDVFAGAYGKVDKMGISPFYLNTVDGNQNPHVKFVACKRFHASSSSHIDSKRELDNLQVLKESITSHGHIRIHLAILFHKGEHLILLPWADHLDLDIFLLGGHTFMGTKLYDFKLRFHQIQPATMINDICTQMSHIADALEWLHKGILGGAQRNRVYFAHMDLKPNNILIDTDQASTVGKWVLTDFGISAFKEDDYSAPTNLLSIRDLYENLTIKTTPRRDPGAYQPPEIEHIINRSLGPGSNAHPGRAGRKGDIWSFGCIFAEVLAFALGQTPAVEDFRKYRKGLHKNDYFYEKVPNQTLVLHNQGTSYQVRSEVRAWLGRLPETYSFPNKAIDCCVQTILDILVADGSNRPRAHDLVRKMEHVANHVITARRPGPLRNCPLVRHSPQLQVPPLPNENPVDSYTSLQHEISRLPSIKRTKTGFEETLLSNGTPSFGGESHVSRFAMQGPASEPTSTQLQPTLSPVADSTQRFETNQDNTQFSQNTTPDRINSPRGLAINLGKDDPSDSSYEDKSSGFRPSFARESRLDLHGVILNQDKLRETRDPVEVSIADLSKSEVLSVSLCPSGHRIAFLVTRPKDMHRLIYLCKISLNTLKLQPDGLPIKLPLGPEWSHIVQSGCNHVVWGNSRGGIKHVYMGSGVIERAKWDSTQHSWLAALVAVAVSKHGSVAFVGTKNICYVNLADIANFRSLDVEQEHTFTHGAFNDDGTLLYAWAFGRPDDRLYVWRIDEATRDLVLPTDSEGSYESKQQGKSNTTLIPYNSYLGCIIRAPGDVFFPAQIRSTHRGSSTTLPKMTTIIPKTVAACVYGDHSLLVVEKGILHTRIREHRIVGGANHIIEAAAKRPMVEWNFSAGKITQMRVVHVPDTDDLMIILCTLENKVVLIPIIARETRS